VSAGLTVGVVALPLAMAFAIASGVKPEAGLITAVIAGFLISALGGSNVQIGGPAGAFIVVVYAIIERYGLANLLISTVLAGGLLFAMGLFRLGGLVRFVPVAVVIGFTNGIAVLIALSQVRDFFGLQTGKLPADFFAQMALLVQAAHTVNLWAPALGLGCLVVIVLWPRLFVVKPPRAESAARSGLSPGLSESAEQKVRRWQAQAYWRMLASLPGTIIALALATLAVRLFELPVETIGQRFGALPQALPAFALPAFSWETVKTLAAPTLTIAMLGAIESLLCARVADNLIADQPSYRKHDPNQELMAQGVANVVTPFFGGLPATGTIARTVTNIRSGASTPLAGVVHALTVLLVLLVAAPLAADVPLAALAAVLLFVAWNMGEWREFARLRQFSMNYRVILLGTFAATVVFDLTVAVELGLSLAFLFFVTRMNSVFKVEPQPMEGPGHTLRYTVHGALFFGAVDKIEDLPLPPEGVRLVVLDCAAMSTLDTTGLEAVRHLRRAWARHGVTLRLENLGEQPLGLVRRSGFANELLATELAPPGQQPPHEPTH
jgi:SulP family sulfate permease